MGVPGLFAFLRRRYPQICSPVEKKRQGHGDDSQQGGVDNLYIDMNHIIHSCTHAHVAKDRLQISTAEMFAGMAAYLQQLLDLLEPRRTVMVAIDGVAPRAKMNQQRTRRFLSAYVSGITDRIEAEVKREMAAEAGGELHIPDVERFDSNIITPGTDFMLQLADWLREWACNKVASDPRFKHCTFIVSDASEPGEGEHKIMRYVRHLKQQPGYDPNTSHIVYGQDADLLLLSLLCHEPHFVVMRENMEAGTFQSKDGDDDDDDDLQLSAVELALRRQQQAAAAAGDGGTTSAALTQQPSTDAAAVAAASHGHLHMPFFEQVDIGVLRECLQWEFSDLVGLPGAPGMYGSDVESAASESDDSDDTNDDNANMLASPSTATSPAAAAAAGGGGGGGGGVANGGSSSSGRGGVSGPQQQPSAVAAEDSSSSDDLEGLLRLTINDPPATTTAGSGHAGGGGVSASASAGAGGVLASPGSSSRGGGAAAAAGTRQQRVRHRGKKGLSFESLLDDLVLLSFLAGNDFLPNVPSIDIYDKPCGLDLLISAFKALLPGMGGHITGGGSINRNRLVQLLVFVARDEENAYKRRAEYRQRRAAQERDKQAAATADFNKLFDGAGLSMGELPPGIDITKLDTLLQQLGPELAQELGLSEAMAANRAAAVDLTSLTPGQLCEEVHNRVAARVKERLMGGDPWAQDPVGMHLQGYRERYYEMRFPELFEELEGDVDKVAARVAYEYVEGMQWVLRYYACGPAAIDWRRQQQQQGSGAAAGSSGSSGGGDEGAALVSGASWSWCYAYHYAPLMQDLSKVKLWVRGSSSRAAVSVSGPISISRALVNPVGCDVEEWAPLGGPVRPLLQLMCVLPAKSVLAALPASLAHLIVLAEAMEEEEQERRQRSNKNSSSRGRQLQQQQQQQQQGYLSKAARKQARKARKAATASRVEGLQGLEVLGALGDEGLSDQDADDADLDIFQAGGGSAAAAAHGEEEQEEGEGGASSSGSAGGLSPTGGAAAGGNGGGLSHLLVSGDAEISMLRLAKELCGTFPNNVEQLVDLTGKRWLHTGVVRLPMAQPQHLASVLQAVLALVQQQQPWEKLPWQAHDHDSSSSNAQQQQAMGLTDAELSRNTFKPAAVITTAAAASAAGVSGGASSSNASAAAAAAVQLSSPRPDSSSSSNSGGSSSADVWKLLTRTTTPPPPPAAAAVGSSTTTTPSPPAAAATAATAARRLGALGMLLAQSGGVHTLSNSTMQRLVPEQQQQQQQQQQQESVFRAELDVAGMAVPQHECCLVAGAEPPHLSVTAAVWRRTAAGFANAVSYSDRVLGIRSQYTDSSNSGGGGGRGGGGRGQRGGARGGGDRGAEARGRARGRGRGQDITRHVFEQQEQMRRQQEQQQQQQVWSPRGAAAAAPAAPPAIDASAYYYNPADDDYSSNASVASSSNTTGTGSSWAARNYMSFGGYDNQGGYVAPDRAPRGRGKIGVGNRGRSYRSNNR